MKQLGSVFLHISMWASVCMAQRDPFYYHGQMVRYHCAVIGTINDEPVCARMWIQGATYLVRVGTCCAGVRVVALHAQSLELDDGVDIYEVPLHKTVERKGPFNLKKLKG